MNRAFLTDDGPTSLAPFFSVKMETILTISLLIVCAALLAAWPRQPPHAYLLTFRTPPVFYLVSAVMLIVYGYLNLCSGRGEVIENTPLALRLHENVVTWEERSGYFSYALPVALMQAVALLVILAPPLAVSAALAGTEAAAIRRTLLIIAADGVFCRMFGFFCFLLWGRWHFLGFMLTRVFFLLFVFGSAVLTPQFSALRILYPNAAGAAVRTGGISGSDIHLSVVTAAIILLMMLNSVLWRRNRKRRTPPAGAALEMMP